VVALLGYQSKWYCIPNAMALKNAQLVPKPAPTDKLTPATALSCLKKCMHKTLAQQKLLALSEYHSTDRVILQVGWAKNPISPLLN